MSIQPMTVLAVILAIFLILVVGFLVIPVSLYIDTDQGRYEVFQKPAFRFFAIIKNETVILQLQIVGINVPLQSKRKSAIKKERKKSKSKSTFRRSVSAWRFLIERSLKSFEVKKVIVDLDTDDVILNAQLVPVLLLASQGAVQLSTNFNGRVYFHLDIKNRPGKILWIFLRFLTKK
jgi:hypothetical protein